MLSRRFLITASVLAPCLAWAHEGHDLSQIEARVTGTRAGAGGLVVDLALQNGRDQAITLAGAYSDLGDVTVTGAASLAPGTSHVAQLTVQAAQWPGIFTLILDFGEAGLGPITVIPSA